MTCNLRHPMDLHHPVMRLLYKMTVELTFENSTCPSRPSEALPHEYNAPLAHTATENEKMKKKEKRRKETTKLLNLIAS